MTTLLEQTWAQLEKSISELKAENLRLKSEADKSWNQQSRIGSLEYEKKQADQKIQKIERELDQSRRDLRFWKDATRYEQQLKKPQRRIRHIPLFNEIMRAKRRDNWPDLYGPKTNPERIFLKRWRKENKEVRGMNNGYGVLELLLSENSNEWAGDISQRDATVAATVIQWLGTNCGRCFLEECEREIKQRTDDEHARRLKNRGAA